MDDSQALAVYESQELTSFEALSQRTRDLGKIYQSLLQQGTDYGVIPGTDKPTLLQPGAQLLALWARLAPQFRVDGGLDDGHYSYRVVCQLTHDGAVAGEGVGYCTTMESKYRYRWVWANELPPNVNKDSLVTKGFRGKNGTWLTKYRMENIDIADQANTVLKLAKKRAFVDAVLTVTGASRIFTQDIEDQAVPDEAEPPPKPVKAKAPEKKPTENGEWTAFWVECRQLGLSKDDVHRILSVSSVTEWIESGKPIDGALHILRGHKQQQDAEAQPVTEEMPQAIPTTIDELFKLAQQRWGATAYNVLKVLGLTSKEDITDLKESWQQLTKALDK